MNIRSIEWRQGIFSYRKEPQSIRQGYHPGSLFLYERHASPKIEKPSPVPVPSYFHLLKVHFDQLSDYEWNCSLRVDILQVNRLPSTRV
jgi:hypothetical protein